MVSGVVAIVLIGKTHRENKHTKLFRDNNDNLYNLSKCRKNMTVYFN